MRRAGRRRTCPHLYVPYAAGARGGARKARGRSSALAQQAPETRAADRARSSPRSGSGDAQPGLPAGARRATGDIAVVVDRKTGEIVGILADRSLVAVNGAAVPRVAIMRALLAHRSCLASPFRAALAAAALAAASRSRGRRAAPRSRRAPPATARRGVPRSLDVTSGADARRAERRRAPRPGVAHQADDRVPRVRARCATRRSRRRRWSTVSERAWRAEGSRMFIEPRTAVSVDELLRGMIVQSGNDASIALAELVAGSEDGVRRADERRGGAARAHEHALRQRDRAVASAALLDGRATSRRLAAALIRDYPRVLPALLAEGIPLQQHHAAQPQPPAVDRSVRRRHEDRAHRGRGLVPDRLGEARRAPPARGRARRRVRRGARAPRRRSSSTTASRPSTRCSSTRRASRCRRCACGRARPTTSPAGFLADQYLTLPKGKADKLALTMTATEPLVAPVAQGPARGHGQGRARGQADRRVSAGRARRRARWRASSAARGIRCACGSSEPRPAPDTHDGGRP